MKRFLHLIILSSCMITGCICMLASCKNGNSYNNGKDGLDPNKPTVTVTIEPFRYFVEQIAGNDVNVNVMVPAGSSPRLMSLPHNKWLTSRKAYSILK